MISTRLAFDPAIDVLRHPGEGIVVRTPTGDHVLDDPVFDAVAAGIVDVGIGASADEDALADHVLAAMPGSELVDAYHAIEFLRSRGYLRAEPLEGHAFAAGIHPHGMPAAREPLTVVVLDDAGRPDVAGMLAEAVESAGHRVSPIESDPGADLLLVVVGARAAERIDALTRGPDGPAVLPVTVARKRLLLGPLHRREAPGVCRTCLEHWLRANEQIGPDSPDEPDAFGHGSRKDVGRLVLGASLHVFAVEVLRLLGSDLEATSLDDTLLSYEPTTQGVLRNHVLPAPGCHRCLAPLADPGATASRGSIVSAESGSRTEPPDRTLQRLQRYVSPVCGILPPPVPASDHPVIHSVSVGMNAAFPRRTLEERRFGVRSMSGGKGRTREQAHVSAICEGIERYAGVYQGSEPTIRRAYADFDGEAIHPDAVQLFSARQYARRALTYDRLDPFNVVPMPFDPKRPVSWTRLESVRGGAPRWLPTALCYYSFLDHGGGGANSNGVAAGSSPVEAQLHGLHELVERDAVAIWWYNRLHVPAFDLDARADPALDRIVEAHHALGRDLWVLDITSDIGIPAAVAVSARRDEPQHIVFGFGAHSSAHVAVVRAVTEVNQFLPSVVDLATGVPRLAMPNTAGGRWHAHATLADHPYLVPHGAPVPVRLGDPAGSSVTDQLDWCLRAVENVGSEVFSLRLTRPEAPLEVYRMVAPGLRHFWARLAPGRLYDVPVRLGHLTHPLAEEDLNPIAMFV